MQEAINLCMNSKIILLLGFEYILIAAVEMLKIIKHRFKVIFEILFDWA